MSVRFPSRSDRQFRTDCLVYQLFKAAMVPVLCAAMAAAFAVRAPGGPSDAPTACGAYQQAKYEEALRLARAVLESQEADTPTKVEAYKCQACTYVETRKIPPARTSIEGMLGLDAMARFSPDDFYPPRVIQIYSAVRDSLFPGTLDINTIAVGDFENNSLYVPKSSDYDYSAFGGALVHTITVDLCAATDLKVVDRQRVNQLIEELKLGQSGFASPEQAVQAGQFLGAQSFIFGQYMILSDRDVRIDMRVVRTATGEIILARQITGEFSGKPKKMLDLEKDLVLAVAQGVDSIRAATSAGGSFQRTREKAESLFEAKRASIDDRKGYTKGVFLIGKAYSLEDAGDFKEAYSIWKKVLEVDPANESAKLRLRALKSIVEG